MKNPFLPIPMRVDKIITETEDGNIKTFNLVFVSKGREFSFLPGQFAQLSVFGQGEAPFGIASTPMEPAYLQFTVNRVGVVTTALHQLEEGETVGVRGPLGNGFPLDTLEGKNVVIIGGGFAFTTLRSLTNYILHEENRSRFGDITVIYGARTPGLLLYKNELEEWGQRDDLALHLTVDAADDGWRGKVGFVPSVTREVAPSPENAYALVCGPPAMIRFTLPVLKGLGFSPARILLSLEMKMKCGIGMCGRCNIGSKYICKDGPVFTLERLAGLPGEI